MIDSSGVKRACVAALAVEIGLRVEVSGLRSVKGISVAVSGVVTEMLVEVLVGLVGDVT